MSVAKIFRVIDRVFGPNAERTAVKAARVENTELGRVSTAQRELADTRSEAITSIAGAKTDVTTAIAAETEAKQKRDARTDEEVAEVIAGGEAKVASLVSAIVLTNRTTDRKVEALVEEGAEDFDEVDDRVSGARNVRDRLAASAAALESALNS